MKWVWLLLAILTPGGLIFYLVGCWLLGEWPWHLWREQTPVMYDGKEPFEQWAEKMERARQAQQREECEHKE